MLKEKMQEALNEQINKEMYSSYLYLAMSAYSSSAGLPGFAHWFRVQAEEENMHAMRLFDYINDQDGRVKLKEIKEPPMDFGTAVEMFQQTLEHEQFITRSINELVELANAEKDDTTASFLQWYVEEQEEEEENDKEIIAKLRGVDKNEYVIPSVDQELAKRPSLR
ncbi:ferritin [Methanosarcina sp. MSH10X1]|uniref:ferritin n=1 Tax=Methanosarcina sp. MSH10X1 TaxID=2507075 RepID=UPI000FFBBFAC|nr:ferritin [Methanosarcina sp. MSH10X1]RXA21254.1 ferritin [Methanosarcina sp. MSH10X1]